MRERERETEIVAVADGPVAEKENEIAAADGGRDCGGWACDRESERQREKEIAAADGTVADERERERERE